MRRKTPAVSGPARSEASVASTTPVNRVGHIVESPGGILNLIDVEVPTEYYYDAYAKDLRARHPKASPDIIEHDQSDRLPRHLYLIGFFIR